MEVSNLILLFAGAHLLVYVGAFWGTRRPIITVFHGFLAASFMAFAVRPIIAVLAGGHTLYPVGEVWDSYVFGLAVQLAFNTAYVGAYLLLWRRPKRHLVPRVSSSVQRGYIISLLTGMAAVAVIHVLSAGAWLPSVRSAAITSVVPYGKLLFPIAVIPLSACFPLGLLVWLRKPGLVLPIALITGLSIILLSLLFQRGFIISGLIITVFFFEKLRRLDYRGALVVILAVFFMLFMIRPLGLIISGASWSSVMGNPLGRFRDFVLGYTFDSVDVWVVAVEYTRMHNLLVGQTLLAVPARFASPIFRRATGMLTAVDRLNEFYWGDQYWSTNFGFSVNLAQEAYMNFGLAGIIFGFLAGVLTAQIDRLLTRLSKYDTFTAYLVQGLFASGGFAGEIGGTLQWVAAYLIGGVSVWIVSRIAWHRISRKLGAPAPATPSQDT